MAKNVPGKFVNSITLIGIDELAAWSQEKKQCAACRKEHEPAAHIMITPAKETDPFYNSVFVHFVICNDCLMLMEQGGEDAEVVKSAIHTYMRNTKLN